MKKQINPTIKAHLIRSACYILLLVAVCVIPFALAQRNTTKHSAVRPSAARGTTKLAGQATKAGPPSAAVARSMLSSKAASAKRVPRAPNLSAWNIVANYPFASESVSVSSDGTLAYAVGGFDPNIGPTNSFNQYDPVADTWTPLANIPGAFYDGPSVYAPNTNRIYVFGGLDATFTPSAVVQIYDVGTGTWQPNGAPMPGARYFAGAVYFNGNIFVAGGFDENFTETTTTWWYDPVADTWNTSLAPIPAPTGGAGYSVVGQNFYLAGTWNGGSGSTQHFRYDMVADTWTTAAPVPVNIYRPDAAAIDTNIYLVGGGNAFVGARPAKGPKATLHPSTNAPMASYTSTYIYDTVTDSWTTGPDTNVPHSFTGGTAIGNVLLVVTGYDGVTGDTNIVEAATAGPTPTPTPLCTPPLTENFDGETPPALPPNWVATNIIDPDGIFWQTSDSGDPQPPADSLPNAVWVNDADAQADKELDSGTFVYPSGAQVTFTQNTDLEESDSDVAYDNGLLEISFDDGATFQEFVAAGGNFVTGGYNHSQISGDFSNPCMLQYGTGQANWSGFSGGFFTTTANLPAAGVGQNVKLRWRECSDVSVSHAGWRVDNVSVFCPAPASPTPTPSGTPICTPAPWQEQAAMPIDLYGAGGASDGTFYYSAGGYSFNVGGTQAVFNRYDPATNSWTSLPDMPQSAILPVAVYYPPTNKIYVFGGEDGDSGTNYNITRIYDIASNSWTTGANMPDVRSFMAGGYNPGDGMIYILSGYNTGDVTSAQNNTWQYDPVADSWTDLTGTDPYPHPAGGFGFGVINNKIYTAGGRDAANTIINDTWEFDPAAPAGSRYTQKTDEPGSFQNNVPGSAVAQGVLWVYGGGNPFVADTPEAKAGITAPTKARVAQTKRSFPLEFVKRLFGHKPNAPDTDSSGRFYDPVSDSWNNSPNMNETRSFTSGAAIGSNLIIASGGYNGFSTVSSAETEDVCAGGGISPTPTPSVSPTCPPGSPNGVAGAWTAGNPYPTTIVRYGFVQTATHFYVFGGVDNGTATNAVNRMDLSTGTWEPRAPMPFGGEAPTCALMESTGIVYCADGITSNQFAAYDIAADSWTPLAPDPLITDHYGSASGAFNGKVFVAGGFSNGAAVDVYDVASNSWSSGTAAPLTFFLAGYHQIGQFLYVVGGFEPTFANNATTWRLDMSSAPGSWDVGPAFTSQLADFGLAYDPGTNKLYSLGGDLPNDGNPFNSTNVVNELDLSGWPGGTWNPSPPDLPLPFRQANQAGFTGNGDIWSVGGLNGQTFTFLNEVWHRSNGGVACPSPTPTPTPSPASPTPTITPPVTPTPTITPPISPTPTITPPPFTPTPTPTETPRETPTPRPRPTPHPRPPH
jgi:N-acetylneuraminic acid mutarotase